MLYVRPNALGNARLGVVAAKRFAPRAVTRNMIKRVARETFRKGKLPACDCVIRLSAPIGKRQQSASSRQQRRLIALQITQLLTSRSLSDAR